MEATRPAGRFYRPELDVVRFIAFLLVFLHHTTPTRSNTPSMSKLLGTTGDSILKANVVACGFGLFLFFTLSAFLICELLLRERDAAGTVGIKQFYIRRILRIWPLYYLAMALGVISTFLPGDHLDSFAAFGWFAVFLGAWHMTLFGGTITPITPLWSISVEEQFYLFAPWVVKYSSRRTLFGFCSALILSSNVWLYFLGRASAPFLTVWTNSFVQFQCFAAGILLCLVLNGRSPQIAFWQRPVLLAGAWCCWFVSIYWLHAHGAGDYGNPGSLDLICGYALASLGSTLILVAFLGVHPRLLPGWAIYLGRISFGLYVYHEFAVHLVRLIPIAKIINSAVPNSLLRALLHGGLLVGLPLVLTVLLAAISYRYFETPFLKMKKRHALIASQPIAGER